MRNYKSWLAFMTFLGAYIYALLENKSDIIVDTTGTLLLVATMLMMVRSEVLGKLVINLSDGLKEKLAK